MLKHFHKPFYRNLCLTISVLLLSLVSVPSAAKIYRYVDENGKLHYGDRKLSSKHVQIAYSWKGWHEVTSFKNWRDNKKLFSPIIDQTAQQHNIDPKLVHAVIQTESYYNPEIKSKAGAVGLMQLMPATAQRFGVSDRKNPRQNIQGGVKYLKVLMKLFNNDLKLVLAGYNAGEGAVKKYGNQIPPYKETQNYVKKVLKLYKG